MAKKFYGWWVTAAAFITFGLSVGVPYYNKDFFNDYFQREFHWSRADITLGFPLAALITLWVGPMLIHRFSPRKLILAGTALTAAALIGFGTMGGLLLVYYGFWVLYTVGYIFSGVGPLGVGIIHQVTGGWSVPLLMIAGSAVLLLLGGLTIARPGYVDDDLAVI